MRQAALPLGGTAGGPARVIVGSANERAVDALLEPARWPYHTAIVSGPPRSGKSLIARWFVESGLGTHGGEAIDDADRMDEAELFHRWNRAQESGRPLLLVSSRPFAGVGAPTRRKWRVRLPDLGSRLGAAMQATVGAPDDAMMAELILLHAELRGLALDHSATDYLVGRAGRSHLAAEQLVAAIDRLSLERKAPPTMAIWREALAELGGKA